MFTAVVDQIIAFVGTMTISLTNLFTEVIPVVLVVTALTYGKTILNAIRNVFNSSNN